MQITEGSDRGKSDPHSAKPRQCFDQAATPEAVEILAIGVVMKGIVDSGRKLTRHEDREQTGKGRRFAKLRLDLNN